jgi:anti-anti-sigma regulatory factor
LLLVLAPNLLQYLPHTALAAVVIASAIGLVEVSDLRRIYRIQRWEFWLSMACFVGVAVLGAIPGIALAIVIAVIEFLWDGWRPHSAVLGRVERVKGYHDISRYPEARSIPGLVLFRWDAPLFFANAELFHERVLDAVANSPTPVRWLVVAAEPVTSVDVTAADAVCELDDSLHAVGIELCFAEMKDPVKDKLKRFGLFTRFGKQSFFATLPSSQNQERRPTNDPLNSIAVAALKELHGRGRRMKAMPVFPSVRTGESLQGSRGWFPSALEEAKIEEYTWHCNRHTFASRLVMAGVDLRTVAELLGHRTLQMVMRYSHLAPEHQASAVDRLVESGNRRDTKSDTGRPAAKTIKRKMIVSS